MNCVPPSGFRPFTPSVTARSIQEVLHANPVVVLHFWAAWNRLDFQMDSCIAKLHEDYADICFVSCDIDSPGNAALCERCEVANIPFLALFVDGERKRGIMGLRAIDELRKELEDRLNDSGAKRK